MNNIVYTFDYLHSYEPPKAIIELEVTLPGRSLPKVSTVMLVDSGADKTMIASDVLHVINAKPVGRKSPQVVMFSARNT